MHYFQIEKNSSQGLEMILTLLTSESCDLSSQWDKDWVNSITDINNWSVILMLAPQPCHNENLLALCDIFCILYIIRLSIKMQNTPTRARFIGTRRVTRQQTRKSGDCPHTNAMTNPNTKRTCEARQSARRVLKIIVVALIRFGNDQIVCLITNASSRAKSRWCVLYLNRKK